MKIGSTNSLNFGAHYVNIDIGASSINGSLKINVLDENGKSFYKNKINVFKKNDKRSEELFAKNVADVIIQTENKLSDVIREKDPDNELYLTACYPGPKVERNGKKGFVFSNFYYDDERNNRFKDIVIADKIDSYLANNGIKIKQSRHVNDMVAAGACLLSKIKKECPEILEQGQEIFYMYPGGGLGSGMLMVDKNNIKIKPTEIQHIYKNGTELTVEKDVGAYGLTKNFADKLNLDDADRAKISTNVMVLDNYEIAKSYLPNLKEDDYNEASKYAINKYLESISQLVATQICASKIKTIVLTGPIANGLREGINANESFKGYPEYANESDDKFNTILKAKILESLTGVGKSILGDIKDFNIKFVKINDNTEGAEILQKSDEIGNPPAWYNIKN